MFIIIIWLEKKTSVYKIITANLVLDNTCGYIVEK